MNLLGFEEQKKKLKDSLKDGDISRIAKKAKVSITIVHRAFTKESIQKMTGGEKQAWKATLKFIQDRKKDIEKTEELTKKIAENL